MGNSTPYRIVIAEDSTLKLALELAYINIILLNDSDTAVFRCQYWAHF